MNSITQYTLAFWFSLLIANMWVINGDMLIAAMFLVNAVFWIVREAFAGDETKEKDNK